MRAAAVVALLSACGLGRLAEAQLRIVMPPSLVKQFPDTHGMIYGTTATFGAPYYGERVMGRLLYGKSKGGSHCDDGDYEIARPATTTPVSGELPGQEIFDVYLVRRGGCTFVTKVKAAQNKGAHAVVVVDKDSSTMTSDEIQHIVMADDGYGEGVRIPSLLVSKFDGNKLIDAVQSGQDHPVFVELAWDIPRGEVVVADFWMSSGSRESGEFLYRFKVCAEALMYHLQFVPHYHVFSLPQGTSYGHLCIRGGSAYCAPDPDGAGPVTGADVVYEDARQLCVWLTTAKPQPGNPKGANYSQAFWEYAVKFNSECPVGTSHPAEDQRFSEACSFRVMSELGISVPSVLDCVKNQQDRLLDEQIRNVAWSPQALRLNGWRYSGALDPETVLKAVCAGYAKAPAACEELLSGYRRYWGSGSGGITFLSLMWTVFFIAAFLAASVYVYRRHLKTSVRKVLREEVMLEVQSQMADYAQLADGETRTRGTLSF